MALFSWTLGSRRTTRIARLADSLLSRNLAGIRDAALPHVAPLSKFEVRGYIRAKATTILSAAIHTAPNEAGIPANLADAVLASAAERAILVLEEQLVRGNTRKPALRRAA